MIRKMQSKSKCGEEERTERKKQKRDDECQSQPNSRREGGTKPVDTNRKHANRVNLTVNQREEQNQ